MLLEDHHGGSVNVDIVLPGQLFSASESDIHVTKGQVISVGKGSQLDGKKAPACVYVREETTFSTPSACGDLVSRTPSAV